MGRRKFPGEGAIDHLDIHLAHAIRLPDAACGTPGHKRQIGIRTDIAGEIYAVETASDISPVRITDESMRHALTRETGQVRSARRPLFAVGELKTPQTQGAVIVDRKSTRLNSSHVAIS